MVLFNKLRKYDFAQLIEFADSLDPNNDWRELLRDDPSITRTELADAMLAEYGDTND